jgi:hypothetical protein
MTPCSVIVVCHRFGGLCFYPTKIKRRHTPELSYVDDTFHLAGIEIGTFQLVILVYLSKCNIVAESESELLYDWRFTAHQFVLATSPLIPTTSIFLTEYLRS